MTKVRRRALGLGMLLTIVLFFAVTIAFYQEAFTSSVAVKLRAASTGNQLLPGSDVKVRGVIVGKVDSIHPTRTGAELALALQPEKVGSIPANVSAKLVPNTLFGERHVALEPPPEPVTASLAAGDVIEQDRTRASVELEAVLSDTMPVLQAVRPDELAVTLNSLSHALEGRGKPLGETLTQLNAYVEQINPSLPQLRNNLQELVGVAQTYEEAGPEVLTALDNLSTTARTLVQQRQNLHGLLGQLTTTSEDTTTFLQANGKNLIRFGDAQRPTMDVLAKYAPQYPCLFNDIARFVPEINKVMGVGTNEPGAHITMEVVAGRGKYEQGQDAPEFSDKRGPRCYDMGGRRAPQYPPGGPIEDGSKPPAAPRSDDLGLANSPSERDFMAGLLAPSMNTTPKEVPQWGSVLVGPVLRGAEVNFKEK